MSFKGLTGKARIAALAIAAATLSGCYSVQCERGASLGKDVEEHVVISNYGWQLLCCIPIVCGNENTDSWCPITFFRDEVDPMIAYNKLLARAKAKNCKLDCVEFRYDYNVMCDWLWDFPIPWIIPYYEVSLSANLVKKGGAK